MSGYKFWGEIEEPKSNYVPDVTADIERSMNNFCLAEFDSDQEQDENQVEHIILDSMDPVMMYAITLHKFAAKMTENIEVAELTKESNVTILQHEDGAPEIPQPPEIYNKHVPNNLNFLQKVTTPFTEGAEVIHPELSSAVAKKVLMQCVATMFAHIGYETTHSEVLLHMTDVLEEFLKKICLRMKTAHDEDSNNIGGSFPHYAEKVLIEFGLDGYKGIHDYYQNRVLKYTNVLNKRCEDLVDYYKKLLVPKTESLSDDIDKTKDDSNMIEEDLFEVQMHPNIEGIKNEFGTTIKMGEEDVIEVQMHPNVEGTAGYASLGQGFQLLKAVEAVSSHAEVSEDGTTTLPNLRATIIGDTVTNVTMPFSKKKRTK